MARIKKGEKQSTVFHKMAHTGSCHMHPGLKLLYEASYNPMSQAHSHTHEMPALVLMQGASPDCKDAAVVNNVTTLKARSVWKRKAQHPRGPLALVNCSAKSRPMLCHWIVCRKHQQRVQQWLKLLQRPPIKAGLSIKESERRVKLHPNPRHLFLVQPQTPESFGLSLQMSVLYFSHFTPCRNVTT